jgi:hypothetical protein
VDFGILKFYSYISNAWNEACVRFCNGGSHKLSLEIAGGQMLSIFIFGVLSPQWFDLNDWATQWVVWKKREKTKLLKYKSNLLTFSGLQWQHIIFLSGQFSTSLIKSKTKLRNWNHNEEQWFFSILYGRHYMPGETVSMKICCNMNANGEFM